MAAVQFPDDRRRRVPPAVPPPTTPDPCADDALGRGAPLELLAAGWGCAALRPPPASQLRPAGNASNAKYLLQVGSFRQHADADRRRGELALLGLEATVEPGDGDNGRWYRVYLGPFESRSEMARARSLTAQADMDTLLLKRESP